MTSPANCPVCGHEAPNSVKPVEFGQDVDCPRCGHYWISGLAILKLGNEESFRYKLSAWIRQQQERSKFPDIHEYTLDSILNSLPEYRVSDKQRLLLAALGQKVATPAQTLSLSVNDDYPLAWAADNDEFRYLIRALAERKLVRILDESTFWVQCEISPDGWDHLDERKPTADTRQVFVAMWFHESMNEAWEHGIKPALEEVGYLPHRVDSVPHIDRIDTKIVADIKKSRFIVADVTGQRQGVYFEAGYAMGLGLDVVWTVKKEHEDDIHFDTRQFNHILWENPSDLKERLANTVVAVIGRGG